MWERTRVWSEVREYKHTRGVATTKFKLIQNAKKVVLDSLLQESGPCLASQTRGGGMRSVWVWQVFFLSWWQLILEWMVYVTSNLPRTQALTQGWMSLDLTTSLQSASPTPPQLYGFQNTKSQIRNLFICYNLPSRTQAISAIIATVNHNSIKKILGKQFIHVMGP